MRKFRVFVLFITVLILSCSIEEEEVIANSEAELNNACTAENPLELEWMQDLIAEMECGKYSCKVSILKSTYEGKQVYYIQMTDPLCIGFDEIVLYDCYGEEVKEFTMEESRNFVNAPDRETEEIFSCNE